MKPEREDSPYLHILWETPKRSAGAGQTLPDVNTGSPWTKADVSDLRWGIGHKHSVDRMAEFLCRTEQEVRDQARELGYGELPPVKGRRKRAKREASP